MGETFSERLRIFGAEQKCRFGTDLYNHFGGAAVLDMELRNFLDIYAGKRAPSVPLFVRIFEVMPAHHRKPLLVAFFSAHMPPMKHVLLDYLVDSLVESTARADTPPWDHQPALSLTIDQLSNLQNDPGLVRSLTALMLYEKISDSKINVGVRARLNRLVSLGIAKYSDGVFYSTDEFALYPMRPGSAPRASVRASYEILMNSIRDYLHFEGSDSQEVGFNVHLVSKTNQDAIIKEGRRFRNWVLSLSVPPSDPTAVPLVFVSCLKTMTAQEFEL